MKHRPFTWPSWAVFTESQRKHNDIHHVSIITWKFPNFHDSFTKLLFCETLRHLIFNIGLVNVISMCRLLMTMLLRENKFKSNNNNL